MTISRLVLGGLFRERRDGWRPLFYVPWSCQSWPIGPRIGNFPCYRDSAPSALRPRRFAVSVPPAEDGTTPARDVERVAGVDLPSSLGRGGLVREKKHPWRRPAVSRKRAA